MRQNYSSEPRAQGARSFGLKLDPHGQATACRDVGVTTVFSFCVCLSFPPGQRIKRSQGDARLARETTRRAWRVAGDPRLPDSQADFRTCQWRFVSDAVEVEFRASFYKPQNIRGAIIQTQDESARSSFESIVGPFGERDCPAQLVAARCTPDI